MNQSTIELGNKKYSLFLLGVIAICAITLFATSVFADSTASITSNIKNDGNTNITSAPIGSTVHLSAVVASTTASTTPTGTIDFRRYQNTTCDGTATIESAVALVAGVAKSSTTTLPNTGLSYIAHYNGQTDFYSPSDGLCKSVTATASSTTLATTLSTTTSVLVGSSVYSSATLGNTTANAGGTVQYKVYTNNSCSTGMMSLGSKTVTNTVIPNSDSLQFNTPGTYYFQSVYSGDTNNSTATSTCGNALIVLATTTPMAHITVDKVTSPVADPATFQFNTTGTGYNSFSLTDTTVANHQAVVAGTYSFSEATSSAWTLSSSTCSLNGATSTTYSMGSNIVLNSGDMIACVITNTKIATTTPPATTTPAGVISGIVYNDKNLNNVKDANEPGLAGWTINLYSGAGFWSPTHMPIMNVVSGADGRYSFTNLANGTYSVEQITKKGWIQQTADFDSIVIENQSSKLDAHFADSSNKKVEKKEIKKQIKQLKDWLKEWRKNKKENKAEKEDNDD